MRTTQETIINVEYSQADGPIVTTMDGRFQVTSVAFRTETFSDSDEVLTTVDAKGVKVRKDGQRHATATYWMPIWGPEVDALVASLREEIAS